MKLGTFIISVGAVLALWIGIRVHAQLSPAAPLKPFVIALTRTLSQPDIPHSIGWNSELAVRSDGSFVEFVQRSDPRRPENPHFFAKITDFSTMRETFVADDTETTTTQALDTEDVQYKKLFPAKICGIRGEVDPFIQGKPDGKLLGFEVFYSTETTQQTEGFGGVLHKGVDETWKTPVLGCQAVLEKNSFYHQEPDGSWVWEATNTTTATRVDFKPVDDAFVIPKGYREIATGDLVMLQHQMYPTFYAQHPPDMTLRLNQAYEKRKVK
ncbi:MAG: hypothetical protein WBC04_18005 [Candidatus Acidiferrales bacterium]